MDWHGKRVAIIGLGVSNRALARYLLSHGAQVTGFDQKTAQDLGANHQSLLRLGLNMRLGPDYLDAVTTDYDTVFLTPGMRKDHPKIMELRRAGVRLDSEIGLFFALCQAPIIGVTGSSGKTTTTSLLGEMLSYGDRPTFVGGNIGTPLIEQVDDIPRDAWVLLELSSFQLEMLNTSPYIGVVTNISPNHLDLHGSMEAYVNAKRRIYQFQHAQDWMVLNAEDEYVDDMAADIPGNRAFFCRQGKVSHGVYLKRDRVVFRNPRTRPVEQELFRRTQIPLRGDHNVENALAAATVAALCGVPAHGIARAVRTFGGVPHRLEFVGEKNGVCFYNDSIATTPARAAAGLASFKEPVVLIAGGYDKGIPFCDLAKAAAGRVRTLVVLGATADKVAAAAAEQDHHDGREISVLRAQTLEEATQLAADAANPGDVVLLSPACASYDMFTSFEERGARFRAAVHRLLGEVAVDQGRRLP